MIVLILVIVILALVSLIALGEEDWVIKGLVVFIAVGIIAGLLIGRYLL